MLPQQLDRPADENLAVYEIEAFLSMFPFPFFFLVASRTFSVISRVHSSHSLHACVFPPHSSMLDNVAFRQKWEDDDALSQVFFFSHDAERHFSKEPTLLTVVHYTHFSYTCQKTILPFHLVWRSCEYIFPPFW